MNRTLGFLPVADPAQNRVPLPLSWQPRWRRSEIAQNSPVPAIGGPQASPVLHSRNAPPKSEFATRFRVLAERWREDTRFASSATSMFMHPAYQEIIGMGRDALPFILTDLAETRSHWFWALRAITGVDPVSPEDRGYVGRMADRWLEWGHAEGLL
jgi:hypothetical protein